MRRRSLPPASGPSGRGREENAAALVGHADLVLVHLLLTGLGVWQLTLRGPEFVWAAPSNIRFYKAGSVDGMEFPVLVVSLSPLMKGAVTVELKTSLYLFIVFFVGIQIGPIFDAHGGRILVRGRWPPR